MRSYTKKVYTQAAWVTADVCRDGEVVITTRYMHHQKLGKINGAFARAHAWADTMIDTLTTQETI